MQLKKYRLKNEEMIHYMHIWAINEENMNVYNILNLFCNPIQIQTVLFYINQHYIMYILVSSSLFLNILICLPLVMIISTVILFKLFNFAIILFYIIVLCHLVLPLSFKCYLVILYWSI